MKNEGLKRFGGNSSDDVLGSWTGSLKSDDCFVQQPMAANRMGIDLTRLTPEEIKELSSNILEVKVFFKTLNTQTLTQSPAYSVRLTTEQLVLLQRSHL